MPYSNRSDFPLPAQESSASTIRDESKSDDKEKAPSHEALALERVVSAAREVYAASIALEAHFGEEGGRQPSTLELARFAAAMQELRDAREAFDVLVSGNREPRR